MNRIKILAVLAALPVALSRSALSALAVSEKSDDIVILYTNDVHCGIDDAIGLDGLALYQREMEATHRNVILADAGDFIQGGTVGTLSDGAFMTELMNTVGYDIATLGNHEFDYSVATLKQRAAESNCGYTCCNFKSLDTGEPVFEPYRLIDLGDVQIGFVGAVTPDAFSSSTPVYFQNDQGEYIYSLCEKDTELYDVIQKNADEVRAKGADYVILLAHLGEHDVLEAWSAQAVIANTTGIDAVIDGHSHDVTPEIKVGNKNGEDVVITQTGTKLANIGKMTISESGIHTELIDNVPAPDSAMGFDESSWTEADDRPGRFVDTAVNLKIHEIESRVDGILSEKVGHTDYTLYDSDPETGARMVRNAETNLGDFVADAYRAVFKTDIAFMNGGGLRKTVKAGDITYGDLLNVLPFGNTVLSAKITGQQVLDMLEFGAENYPEEKGGFLSVSGLTYEIDTNIKSSVTINDHGEFTGVAGEYRVKNVMIGGDPLDLNKTYTAASINYLLKNGGDGFIVSNHCEIVKDTAEADIDVVLKYLKDELNGQIPDTYKNPNGDGRIKAYSAAPAETEVPAGESETTGTTADSTDPQNGQSAGNQSAPQTGDADLRCFWLLLAVSAAAAFLAKRRNAA